MSGFKVIDRTTDGQRTNDKSRYKVIFQKCVENKAFKIQTLIIIDGKFE
jgi:hypothetical protein